MFQGLNLRYLGVCVRFVRAPESLRVYILISESNIFGNLYSGYKVYELLRFCVPWYVSIAFEGLFLCVSEFRRIWV